MAPNMEQQNQQKNLIFICNCRGKFIENILHEIYVTSPNIKLSLFVTFHITITMFALVALLYFILIIDRQILVKQQI